MYASDVAAAPPTPEEYVGEVGGDARIVPAGELIIDGYNVICGHRLARSLPRRLRRGLSRLSHSQSQASSCDQM